MAAGPAHLGQRRRRAVGAYVGKGAAAVWGKQRSVGVGRAPLPPPFPMVVDVGPYPGRAVARWPLLISHTFTGVGGGECSYACAVSWGGA